MYCVDLKFEFGVETGFREEAFKSNETYQDLESRLSTFPSDEVGRSSHQSRQCIFSSSIVFPLFEISSSRFSFFLFWFYRSWNSPVAEPLYSLKKGIPFFCTFPSWWFGWIFCCVWLCLLPFETVFSQISFS